MHALAVLAHLLSLAFYRFVVPRNDRIRGDHGPIGQSPQRGISIIRRPVDQYCRSNPGLAAIGRPQHVDAPLLTPVRCPTPDHPMSSSFCRRMSTGKCPPPSTNVARCRGAETVRSRDNKSVFMAGFLSLFTIQVHCEIDFKDDVRPYQFEKRDWCFIHVQPRKLLQFMASIDTPSDLGHTSGTQEATPKELACPERLLTSFSLFSCWP